MSARLSGGGGTEAGQFGGVLRFEARPTIPQGKCRNSRAEQRLRFGVVATAKRALRRSLRFIIVNSESSFRLKSTAPLEWARTGGPVFRGEERAVSDGEDGR
jgi:hypothetical protein